MLCRYYVGYFDPCDPYELANFPEGRIRTRPKVQRPLPREAVKGSIPERFSAWIEWEEDGYLSYVEAEIAQLKLWYEVEKCLHSLADKYGAIVLFGMQKVIYPPDAEKISETHFAKLRETRELSQRAKQSAAGGRDGGGKRARGAGVDS